MLDDMVNRMDSREAMNRNNKDMMRKSQMTRHIMESKKDEPRTSKIERYMIAYFKFVFIFLILSTGILILIIILSISSEIINAFLFEIRGIVYIIPILTSVIAILLISHKPKKKPKKILCYDIIQSNKKIYEVRPYTRLSSMEVEFHERTKSVLDNLTRPTQEFKINEFLTLKLQRKRTELYVNGHYFLQCMYLLLNIPKEEIQNYDEINSIDEAVDINYSEKSKELENLSSSQKEREFQITPEEEFQAHCSNLQAWYEHDYDTRLLHSNLAFPLLKRLTEVGDPLAKKVFKEEIALRLESGCPNVIIFLIKKHYLDVFEHKELKSILYNPVIYDRLKNCANTTIINLRKKVEKTDRLLRQARNRAKKYKYEYSI